MSSVSAPARGEWIWWNGKIVPIADAKISLLSHTIHYGTGAFEGIRCYAQVDGAGGVFRLKEHIDRLLDSAKILSFSVPFSRDEIVKACVEVCIRNNWNECYLRPLLFLNDQQLGVYPGDDPQFELAILSWKWGAYLGEKALKEGTRLKISSFIRPHVNSTMTRGKISGHYVNSVLAKKEARMSGFDEALLLDKDGFLTEGSGENLFMIKGGTLITSPLTSILSGITRRTVMEVARSLSIPVVENRFTRDDLYCADEAFLCGTAAEITPIQSVDARVLGEGKPGPTTLKLVQQYKDLVRGQWKPEFAKDWITRFGLE